MSSFATAAAAAQEIPDQAPTFIIVSTLFLALTTLFFATRLLWRLSHTQQLGWDDLMASLAYVTLVVQTSFGYAAAHYGFGKHRADLAIAGFQRAMRWFWAYQICYKLLGGFTKLNFCFLYLRIFDGSGLKTFQLVVWITAGIITAGTIAFTIGTISQCLPIQRNWDHGIEGSCIDYLAFWFAHAAFNTFMDLVVYVLPILPLLHLQIARRTKAGLLAIFALGAFTIAASIARMAMLPRSAKSTADPTWGSMPALTWTEVEANTAVICCCLPALRVVAVRVWRRIVRKGATETTPTPQNKRGKSRGWEWLGLPGLSKGFGITTEARYSPNNTAAMGGDNDGVERRQQEGWFQRQFRPMSPRRGPPLPPSPPSSSSSFPSSGGSSSAVIVGDEAPRLELNGLGIYKTTQVQTNSNRQSMYEAPPTRRDVNLKTMQPRSEGEAEGRVGGKERSMTLKEMLDEGPITRPSPSVPRWR